MAKFVLTEEQYNRLMEAGALSEETVIKGNTPEINSKVDDALKNANGETEVVIKDTSGSNTNTSEANVHSTSLYEEGTLITKKELKERRLKKLRENSEIIPVKKLFGL